MLDNFIVDFISPFRFVNLQLGLWFCMFDYDRVHSYEEMSLYVC